MLEKNAIKLKITIQLKTETQARAKEMRPTVDDGPSYNEEVTITTKETVNLVENHNKRKVFASNTSGRGLIFRKYKELNNKKSNNPTSE